MRIEDAPFTVLVASYLAKVRLEDFYLKHVKFLNYAFVCGVIGVLVSYIAYHLAGMFVWEPIAYYVGVGVGALSNYTFTVGSLGHWFGLAKEPEKPQ